MANTTLRVALGAAVVALIATAAAWFAGTPRVEDSAPRAVVDAAAVPVDPSPPPAASEHPALASVQGRRRQRLRLELRRARQVRQLHAAQQSDDGLELPVAVGNPATEQYVKLVLASNIQLAEQMELFDDCLEGEWTAGKIVLETDLVGEPGVGMLFDAVSPAEDTVGDEALAECLSESLLAVELKMPEQAFYQHYRYEFDFASGQQLVHAVPTAATTAAVKSRFPELEKGPYGALVDDQPDEVLIGRMPARRDAELPAQ